MINESWSLGTVRRNPMVENLPNRREIFQLASGGLCGLSVEDIARRAGLIAGIPVPANATKDEMIALLNQAVNEVVAAAGCSIINPVVVATTDNIPLFGVQTIDDVTVIPDDRVLVKNPNSGSEGSEEHTSELQALMRISYAVVCLT